MALEHQLLLALLLPPHALGLAIAQVPLALPIMIALMTLFARVGSAPTLEFGFNVMSKAQKLPFNARLVSLLGLYEEIYLAFSNRHSKSPPLNHILFLFHPCTIRSLPSFTTSSTCS